MQTVAGRAPSPAYQVLYQFDGASGYFPAAPMIDVNGTLHGTTANHVLHGDAVSTAFALTPLTGTLLTPVAIT
jgi:hypothetical protein